MSIVLSSLALRAVLGVSSMVRPVLLPAFPPDSRVAGRFDSLYEVHSVALVGSFVAKHLYIILASCETCTHSSCKLANWTSQCAQWLGRTGVLAAGLSLDHAR